MYDRAAIFLLAVVGDPLSDRMGVPIVHMLHGGSVFEFSEPCLQSSGFCSEVQRFGLPAGVRVGEVGASHLIGHHTYQESSALP